MPDSENRVAGGRQVTSGTRGYAVDGPLAAAFGPAAIFAACAAYGLLSSAAVLMLPSVRAVIWTERPG